MEREYPSPRAAGAAAPTPTPLPCNPSSDAHPGGSHSGSCSPPPPVRGGLARATHPGGRRVQSIRRASRVVRGRHPGRAERTAPKTALAVSVRESRGWGSPLLFGARQVGCCFPGGRRDLARERFALCPPRDCRCRAASSKPPVPRSPPCRGERTPGQPPAPRCAPLLHTRPLRRAPDACLLRCCAHFPRLPFLRS